MTGGLGYDLTPDWSPDRSRIAFARGVVLGDSTEQADIYVVAADGTGEDRLTASGSDQLQPKWSPDGTRILFASDQGGSLDVWVMDADGHHAVQLTDEPADEWDAAWHPNGNRIAYTVYPDEITESTLPAVWTMAADGSDQTLLISGMASPAYSPDGSMLVVDSGALAGLAIVDARSGEIIQLLGGIDLIAAEPSWSSDAKWIVYRRGLTGNEAELHLVSVDGSQDRVVTRNQTFDGFPDWS